MCGATVPGGTRHTRHCSAPELPFAVPLQDKLINLNTELMARHNAIALKMHSHHSAVPSSSISAGGPQGGGLHVELDSNGGGAGHAPSNINSGSKMALHPASGQSREAESALARAENGRLTQPASFADAFASFLGDMK